MYQWMTCCVIYLCVPYFSIKIYFFIYIILISNVLIDVNVAGIIINVIVNIIIETWATSGSSNQLQREDY